MPLLSESRLMMVFIFRSESMEYGGCAFATPVSSLHKSGRRCRRRRSCGENNRYASGRRMYLGTLRTSLPRNLLHLGLNVRHLLIILN